MINITLRNYRGFTSDSPAQFALGSGFTAFIGKNNSGKSTCLRALFELRSLFGNPHLWFGKDANAQIQCPTEPDPLALLHFDNDDPAFVTVQLASPRLHARYQIVGATLQIDRSGRVFSSSIKLQNATELIEIQRPYKYEKEISIEEMPGISFSQIDSKGKKWHFFSVDFSDALQVLSRSVFYGAYRNAINEGGAKHYDIAVGTESISQWDYWKAGPNIANQLAIARVEDNIARLLGYTSVDINASADNKSLQVRVNKHPYKLSDLGAGVAELIITLSNALIRQPSLILIDEPESHLHPSLQVDFLTTLASYASHGVAFSTHSIGLARSVADRIYAVSRSENKSSCVVFEKQAHLSELLGNLSYSGYFPLENIYVLLVEGSTEVRTFQVLLRKLDKDHAFVILPLGGSSLIKENSDIELGEVVRIAGGSNKVFAVIDSEKVSPATPLSKSRVAFQNTCTNLKINCLVTERRATENYFSSQAINKAFRTTNRPALTEFELLKELPNAWAKADNWRIANEENDEFFSAHDLGRFLKTLPS